MAKRPRKRNPLESSRPLPRDSKLQYWRGLADFWFAAAKLQAERCRLQSSSAQSRIVDLHFYVVACQRLRNLAAAMKSEYPDAADALAVFDQRWPKLENLRDLQEHLLDPNVDPERGLFGVAYFGEFIANLQPGGKVEYLIDTRNHEPALNDFHGALIRIISEAQPDAEQLIQPERE